MIIQMLIKQLLNVFVSTAIADGLLGPIYGNDKDNNAWADSILIDKCRQKTWITRQSITMLGRKQSLVGEHNLVTADYLEEVRLQSSQKDSNNHGFPQKELL